jgi:hypothetical protein
MRDEDLTTAGSPQQMTLGGDVEAPPDERTPQEQQAAELSRAAREAVRHTDPRIDRQLARMGLTDEDVAPRDDGGRVPARVVRAEDLARLEDELAEAREAADDARTRLARADRRLQLLTWAVTLEGIAIAILAVLVLLT